MSKAHLMKRRCIVVIASCLVLVGSAGIFGQTEPIKPISHQSAAKSGPLLVKPYLQLGHIQSDGKLVVVWHTTESDLDWVVEYKPGAGRRWQTAQAPTAARIAGAV